ncbi:MAG TPA: FAD-dependent oxidoreductase, partial [Syntrophomonadaceae bacterium]|nr:FAD-dependent oxidoreductase [Syntrophomonadaceae bacterium]
KGISRRSFLKGAALGTAGIASVGMLAGCGPKEKDQKTSADGDGDKTGKASFETPPAQIPDSEIKETVDADVVVVGAGLAGLCAAVSAAESGAKTVLIEKRETFTARGMHNAAVDSRLQKKLGIKVDKVQAVRDLIRWSGHRVREDLHWLFVNKSGESMDWLMDMTEAAGLETVMWGANYKGPDYYEYPVTHMFVGGPNEAKFAYNEDVASVLEQNAKKHGVDIHYETPAAQLVRKDNKGRVTGVIGGTKGNYTCFNAKKGVILCTGDYSGDEEMTNRYCPIANDVDFKIYTPQGVNTGDGHKMGLWVGAAMQKAEPHAAMIHTQAGAWSYCFLHVNKHGLRYENEDITAQAGCVSKTMQPDKIGWSVYDDNFLEVLPKTLEKGGGMFWDQVARKHKEPWNKEAEKMTLKMHLEKKLVLKADSIEELAEKMKVPVDNFKATVARYNELAKQGKDLDFGKRSELLFPIEKPPFYAGSLKSALLVITGGLRINNKMQVLDKNDSVVPGLYAAGNTAGSFFAQDYPTIFPGHSHGRCITFGRLAGQFVVAE